ncbi:hypothetical protein AAUPMC_18909, partial [Pasteurella multocida subsp. multocida str. Anand1_cattle]
MLHCYRVKDAGTAAAVGVAGAAAGCGALMGTN